MTEDQIQQRVYDQYEREKSGGLNHKINIRGRSEWKEGGGRRRLRKSWLEQVDEFLKKKKRR